MEAMLQKNPHLFWSFIIPWDSRICQLRQRTTSKSHGLLEASGPSDWIRTSGLLNPIQARYQTSPHPDICFVSQLPEYISTPFQKKQALFFFFPKNFFRQKIRKTSPQSRVLRLRGLILILRAYKNRLRFRTGRAFPVLKSEKLPHESS